MIHGILYQLVGQVVVTLSVAVLASRAKPSRTVHSSKAEAAVTTQ